MFSLIGLTATATPTQGGDGALRPGLDPAEVTPGLLGFLATLFLVVAVIFLIRDMTRRIRRVRYREMMSEDAVQDGSRDPSGDASGKPEERVSGENPQNRRPGKYGPDAS